MFDQIDDDVIALLKETASPNKEIRQKAQAELALAFQKPIREAVFHGDNLGGIYVPMKWPDNSAVEIPLDLVAPGEEDEFTAYTHPGVGYIPEKQVRGNYVTIQTYGVANSINWELKFARNAVFPIVQKAIDIMKSGFVKKMNNDGWHTILAAVVDRNVLVYDADATAGTFTKRLVSMAKTIMARQGGGNAQSSRRGRLTDIFMSLEGLEDIRNWDASQADEATRREIYLASDDSDVVTKVFGVSLHGMFEFGVGQEYQNYFVNQLGGAIQGSDTELAIGLNLTNASDTFLMPVKRPVEIYADDNMHRRGEEGYYGDAELGFAVLDNRNVIALSY